VLGIQDGEGVQKLGEGEGAEKSSRRIEENLGIEMTRDPYILFRR